MSQASDLLVDKHRDYGQGNIMAFGELGLLVRANDKLERLKNLTMRQQNPTQESIEDSWTDLLNYAAIALMLRRGWFGLPLGDNLPKPEPAGRLIPYVDKIGWENIKAVRFDRT